MGREKLDVVRNVVKAIPKPCAVSDVAKKAGLSKATASKWLTVLEFAGELQVRKVGNCNAVVECTKIRGGD